ncbi:putative baseplate assembly protein [Brasilonema sp. UFV-L1]|uniref:putative baseplate assembly protein n=1 Tax=Brasilonema sp. UFV-L1 TaxID=2234130 RepID=UPI00145C6214|nr:putative baseplate assembly protein [Brasilonema sp. UFV-L1]NMG08785.1 putative baseplate assembly protein [Brasilonema sp. UFV-L1]
MMYFCCNQQRREVVKESTFNGIDYLEVIDENTIDSPRQQTLLVRCFKALPTKTVNNVVSPALTVNIEGGTRIYPVKILWVAVANAVTTPPATPLEQAFFTSLPEAGNVLVIRTDSAGDFSTYRLILRESSTSSEPPANFDSQLAAVDFSFKVECPSDFDCRTERVCPPEVQLQPEIDYLAKDFASFRQLMLDRMALLMPQWQERNLADIGITLVELLAYVGDHLSYQQDAIATEAYLDSSRSRISVRRHARLVDYFMHNGCNARVWVQVQVEADINLTKSTQLLTQVSEAQKQIAPGSETYKRALFQRPEVFETIYEAKLFAKHNTLNFYTWGDDECCLPKGTTRATLREHYSNLKVGDILIFTEVLGPQTGEMEDADPTHRHAVRLIDVKLKEDRLGGLFEETRNNDPVPVTPVPVTPVPVTEIVWDAEDALPFALCISAKTDREHGEKLIKNVSVALGNIVLADHGQTIPEPELLGAVPQPTIYKVPAATQASRCQEIPPEPVPPRFNPRLQLAPLTQAVKYDDKLSATRLMQWLTKDAVPQIHLTSNLNSRIDDWEAKPDLLKSRSADRQFVAEVEEDGRTYIRFGDDISGLRPASGTEFRAIYRVGNGVAGNVGARAIAHIVTNNNQITGVCNPLPASGGVEPESIEDVRQKAPFAFRTQERAVTPEDYAEVTARHPQVQKAAATFRWTGSWYTVFVTVDRLGGLAVDDKFKREIRQFLEKYRMAGYDLEIDAPRFVSLEIDMQVCVNPGYFRSDVKSALLQVFSNRILPNGTRGVFHPDNFTFGQPVYLSPLYAAALAVPGVDSVIFSKFQRQGTPSQEALDKGFLVLGRLEIARLNNDRNFPEQGVLRFSLEGGK